MKDRWLGFLNTRPDSSCGHFCIFQRACSSFSAIGPARQGYTSGCYAWPWCFHQSDIDVGLLQVTVCASADHQAMDPITCCGDSDHARIRRRQPQQRFVVADAGGQKGGRGIRLDPSRQLGSDRQRTQRNGATIRDINAQRRTPHGPAHAHACAHGLITVTPAASNGLASRVATANPLAAAMAAM